MASEHALRPHICPELKFKYYWRVCISITEGIAPNCSFQIEYDLIPYV